ncbi:MAG: beta-galactosidase [Phycisphaerae bacterium]
MRSAVQCLLALALLAPAALSKAADAPAAPAPAHTFAIGDTDFLLDGQRLQIRCGEIHAARVPREYWRHRLRMARAMGLNTVCAYLFWNMHEPKPGEFNFSGQADIAEFCRIAQQEGLWVILRPGPYACAEWEMGGFPWWLLKDDGIKLRTRDPRYMAAVKEYLHHVGQELAPLQITRGGPILMVQVENEYGFYGKDSQYMGELRQTLIDSGFNVPLFACNPVQHLKDGYRDDLFPVVNFGSDPAGAFAALRKILPKGPLMCGEFYPGWFDTWGSPHHTGNMDRYLSDLEYMLKNDRSFSIYMAHGGTSFGLWAGADRPFKPDTSSYDYDAPISEAGWVTDKFTRTRELISKYLLPGEKLPEPPAQNPVTSFPAITPTEIAPLFNNLPNALTDATPHHFEHYDLGYGAMLYRTTLPAAPEGTLSAADVHDWGHVYLDGKPLGVMDRRSRHFTVQLPAHSNPATLDILVETAGRVNFGAEVHDEKGLYTPVKFTPHGGTPAELTAQWQIFPLPLDNNPYQSATFTPFTAPTRMPAYYRFTLSTDHPADTFLDMRSWGKGIAWVNGHCLGRYWSIGPTQTMYLPGPWLNPGANDIVLLDFNGPEKPQIRGLEKPILDELHPDRDFSHEARAKSQLTLTGISPACSGSFPPGTALQEVKLPAPATGRYFCIESLDAQDNKPYTAIAELDLLDADGKPLSHEGWTIAYVDSEERAKEDGTAENAIDGQTTSFWHTQWSDAQPKQPHFLVLDLGKPQTISGFRYVPRQGANGVGGRIKDYKIYIGDNLVKR